jgi:hypothetical protein
VRTESSGVDRSNSLQLDSADGLYTADASLTASPPSSSPSPFPSDRHMSTNPPFSHQNREFHQTTRTQHGDTSPTFPSSSRLMPQGATSSHQPRSHAKAVPAPRILPPRGKRKGIDDQVSKTRWQARVNLFCSARPSPLCCARDESRLRNSKRFATGSLSGCERSLHPLTFSQGMSYLV